MATTYCSRCGETAVYKAGEVCSSCRYKLRHPESFPNEQVPPASPVDPEEIDLAVELRTNIAMFVDQRRRLQEALAGDGLFKGDTLNEMTKLTRGLEVLVELELKLRKAARGKVLSHDQRIDTMVTWAREDLPKAKLERLKTLVAEL